MGSEGSPKLAEDASGSGMSILLSPKLDTGFKMRVVDFPVSEGDGSVMILVLL